MYEFKLPDLGEGIHEGEILKWHVEAGATIKEDQALVDVETDKAAVTIPSPKGGRIVALNGAVGTTVKVGQVIVTIDDGAGTASGAVLPAAAAAGSTAAAPATPAAAPPAGSAQAPSGPAAAPKAPVAPSRVVPAAPATRKLARELGIDIGLITGTGPGGRVSAEDVQRFAAGGGAAAGPGRGSAPHAADVEADAPLGGGAFAAGPVSGIPFLEVEPMPDFAALGPVEREAVRSIRRKVAKKMTTSMILVPHVAHIDDADVTELEAWRKKERERRAGQPGGKLTLLPFVVKAVAAALKEYPVFNASLDPQREEIVYKKYYHIGIAVDSGRGLVVPVVKDADRKSVQTIAREIEDLAARARVGKLDASEMKGSTFTITNVGPLGGKILIPTINYPEAAILAMATAKPQPVVQDGQVVVRTLLPLTLAFDHRIADGADGARFTNSVIRRLSDPMSWLFTAE